MKESLSIPVFIEGEDVLLDFDFNFTPGRPAVMYLPNGDPGYPAEPPEVEITSISRQGEEVPKWLFAVLAENEKIYNYINSHAEEEGPDADAAYDAARDED